MNGSIRARLQAIRTSYWFLPGFMALLAVTLGGVMIWVDVRLGSGWVSGISWYQQIRADGAREVLSTIAGSMITVAGVVFSITIVALSYASTQYGPRVLTNFMTDRGNKFTLGTFIATFLYSLVVLRTIRGGEDDFVPQYAGMVAMLLAVCSIGVLIYFIHHVPQSIHINNVVARIGEQLVADTRRHFPSEIGTTMDGLVEGPQVEVKGSVRQIHGVATGYIQSIDYDAILALAQAADLLIRLRYRPGDFVIAQRSLADISPGDKLDAHRVEAIRRCFNVGRKRTPEGDVMFLVSELVEIAARALSPGVNDPITAATCLDWLGAGAQEFTSRKLPEAVRADSDGVPRLVARPDDFAAFVACGFGRIRNYAAGDAIASLHFLRVLADVADGCRLERQVRIIREEVTDFTEIVAKRLEGATARDILHRSRQLQAQLFKRIRCIDAAQVECV